MEDVQNQENKIKILNREYAALSETDLLRAFLTKYKGFVALSSSLSIEDQVLTHMVIQIDPAVRIFTLDTGRLFPETYDLIARNHARYKTSIEIYFPDFRAVEKMVQEKGINLFYDSVENRQLCCHIRKIEPLKRAFHGLKVWICGLRKDQSITRADIQRIEWDKENGLIKLNPLIDWHEEMVWDYIREHNIPYNPLYDQGYASIGCQPCTRAIEPGEDIRAGRWWWENPDTRECGLHRM